MNLRQLYYFKELVTQKQFSKAAKKLHISQPSLSNSIKSLEEELDCQLIVRASNQISLTNYGQIFYKTAIASISSIESAKLKIEHQKLLEKNILTLASIPTAFNSFLLSSIQKYQKTTKSQVKFIYHNKLSPEICAGIHSGEYDLGICAKDNKYSDLIFTPLYNEKIVLITRNDNKLTQFDTLSPSELSYKTIFTYRLQSSLGKRLTETLLKENEKIKVRNISNDDISLASTIISNNQMAVTMKSEFLEQFDIKQIPLKLPKDTITIYLAYKKEKEEKLSNLIEYLSNQQRL